ncbi:MAG: S8 family serine peptidase, partial [Acidimicrobiia bacterium]
AQGSGSYSDVINGINDAVGKGAKVISMSLGGANFSQALQDVVTNAVTAGVVVLASAGNDGNCAPNYPAALAGVISVAATQQAGGLASYSQRGSNVDIAAPGDSIDSTLNTGGYGVKSGTSMATPFASAAAALLLAKCPEYTPAQVETRLESNTTALAGIQPGSGALRADLATAGGC